MRVDSNTSSSDPNRVSVPFPLRALQDAGSSDADDDDGRVEYEEILAEKKGEIDRDPLKSLLVFPENDVDVGNKSGWVLRVALF